MCWDVVENHLIIYISYNEINFIPIRINRKYLTFIDLKERKKEIKMKERKNKKKIEMSRSYYQKKCLI